MDKRILLLLGIVLVAGWVAITGAVTHIYAEAARPTLTPTPTSTSPVTPPTPIVTVTPQPAVVGAVIELHVSPLSSNLRTVVQWQDGLGNWHDVEGWRGDFDAVEGATGVKRWWLPDYLFGQGPFRWQVYDIQSEAVLAHSAVFDLPTYHGQVLKTVIEGGLE